MLNGGCSQNYSKVDRNDLIDQWIFCGRQVQTFYGVDDMMLTLASDESHASFTQVGDETSLPGLVKLVYNSNNYGLYWFMVLITTIFMGFINQFITGGGNQIVLRGSGRHLPCPPDRPSRSHASISVRKLSWKLSHWRWRYPLVNIQKTMENHHF